MLNVYGFFGFFKGLEKKVFEVRIKRPADFYASTSLEPIPTAVTNEDLFKTNSYYSLADAPIMYNRPDTSSLMLDRTKVMVSVFSPNKKHSASVLLQEIKPIMEAQKKYLGGKLPVDKYVFIVYLSDWQNLTRYGGLEHGQSTVLFLPEKMNQDELITSLKDVASHEFFHVVTPLTIHSEEIGNFDFINPRMSRHLWLYEGLTEYAAHHAQLQAGLIDLQAYLDRQVKKMHQAKSVFGKERA